MKRKTPILSLVRLKESFQTTPFNIYVIYVCNKDERSFTRRKDRTRAPISELLVIENESGVRTIPKIDWKRAKNTDQVKKTQNKQRL